ncbi:hypothetical protein HD806DRAFT_525292 [Xylariaceae sp. AK1471]|nr:hypothetical protein HD806DRAFT_525292 [Xylariaceae sp. AK1471]
MRCAIDGRNTPEILFVSNTAVKGLLQQGYARSKYVCERLLAKSVSASGNPAAVLRVGQVCGPVSGTGIRFWNASEWLPSLVISSKFIGAVLGSLGGNMAVVDWVPVDKLGESICELLGSPVPEDKKNPGERFRMFNIVHPAATSWDTLLPVVVWVIERASKHTIDVVPSSEWIDRLEKSEKGSHVIRQNPAAKLIDFLRQAILITTTDSGTEVKMDNLLRVSETLAPINGTQMERWMKGWGI